MEDSAAAVFADADIEILPPEGFPNDRPACRCACCGKPANMDEDCYGICEECLSP